MPIGDKTGKTGKSRCCGAPATEEFVPAHLGAKSAVAKFICSACGNQCRVFLNTINQDAPTGEVNHAKQSLA